MARLLVWLCALCTCLHVGVWATEWGDETGRRLIADDLQSHVSETATAGDGQLADGCFCVNSSNCSSSDDSWHLRCFGNSWMPLPSEVKSKITYLEVIECNWTTAGSNIFGNFTQLTVLRARRCDLGILGQNTLAGLNSLQHLDIRQCQLQTFAHDALIHVPHLKGLIILESGIVNIPDEFFQHSNLTYLKLQGTSGVSCQLLTSLNSLEYLAVTNSIFVFPCDDWLRHFFKLQVLVLSNNNITRLNNGLVNSKSLQTLDLSSNMLNTVHASDFVGLQSLQHLNLSGNDIYNIDANSLKPLVSLITLDLNKNNFHELEGFCFSANEKLRTLHLSHLRNLACISNNALSGLLSLERLYLSSNPNLYSLPADLFRPAHKLRQLDISNNNLTGIPHSIASLGQLEDLKAYNNKWICHCSLIWAQELHELNQEPQEMRCWMNSNETWVPLSQFLLTNCSSWSLPKGGHDQVFRPGGSALLECNVTGKMKSTVTWVTPLQTKYHWEWKPIPFDRIAELPDVAQIENSDRIQLLRTGDLFIHEVLVSDLGIYTCFARNSFWNMTAFVTLRLDTDVFVEVKLISILVGLLTCLGFLFLSLIFILVRLLAERHGCCPWLSTDRVPRSKHLRQLILTMEQCRIQQLEKLRENYTGQVHRIKDNFAQQVERLRDSYQSQVQHIRDFRDYGTQQLTSYRVQYQEQVKRVRCYSVQQLGRVRENYLYQRNRVCKFSAHQFIRLRETYKFQQQTVIKIMENFPMLYFDNCRTGMCQRTDSVVFDEEKADVEGESKSTFKSILPSNEEIESFDGCTSAEPSQSQTPQSSVARQVTADIP